MEIPKCENDNHPKIYKHKKKDIEYCGRCAAMIGKRKKCDVCKVALDQEWTIYSSNTPVMLEHEGKTVTLEDPSLLCEVCAVKAGLKNPQP